MVVGGGLFMSSAKCSLHLFSCSLSDVKSFPSFLCTWWWEGFCFPESFLGDVINFLHDPFTCGIFCFLYEPFNEVSLVLLTLFLTALLVSVNLTCLCTFTPLILAMFSTPFFSCLSVIFARVSAESHSLCWEVLFPKTLSNVFFQAVFQIFPAESASSIWVLSAWNQFEILSLNLPLMAASFKSVVLYHWLGLGVKGP